MDTDILYRHLSNRCTPEETEYVSGWIAESERNARYLFRMEELYALGRRDPYDEMQRLMRAEVRFFRRMSPTAAVKVRRWIKRIGVAAAVVAICAGVSVLAMRGLSEADMVVVATSSEEVTDMELPDGSHVWLNKDSRLSYPKQFDGDSRDIKLNGEAYFEVAENAAVPFIVEGEGMTVTVHGTSFNFNCRHDGSVVKAALIQGEIEAVCEDGGGHIILKPGQRAEYDRGSGRFTVSDDMVPIDAVWHDDLIPFDHATIPEIAEVLKRIYGVTITMGADVDRISTYSGVVKRRDSIQQVLNSLEHTIPFDFTIEDGDRVSVHPFRNGAAPISD